MSSTGAIMLAKALRSSGFAGRSLVARSTTTSAAASMSKFLKEICHAGQQEEISGNFSSAAVSPQHLPH
jgi:hypothetical protein